MAAFKQLNSQDIIVSPLEVNKGYRATIQPIFSSSGGYSYITYGVGEYSESLDRIDAFGFEHRIERYLGENVDPLVSQEATGIYQTYPKYAIYNSIKQLYYSNFLSGSEDLAGNFISSDVNEPYFRPDGVVTGSVYNPVWDNYRQTDLLEQKIFPTASGAKIGVLSIPIDKFGDKIQPGSFRYEQPAYSSSNAVSLYDDGEGRVYLGSTVIGNIIYTHGIVTITNPIVEGDRFGYHYQDYSVRPYGTPSGRGDFFKGFISGSQNTASFSSSYTLYETQYKVTIGESEFNYTQNPSTTIGSNGNPYDYITGSYFSPYITTVGLYNDAYELLAVGKLAKPLPTSQNTDTTILVNIDRH